MRRVGRGPSVWMLVALLATRSAGARIDEIEPNDLPGAPGTLSFTFPEILAGDFATCPDPPTSQCRDLWRFGVAGGTLLRFTATARDCDAADPIVVTLEVRDAAGALLAASPGVVPCSTNALLWPVPATGFYHVAARPATGAPSAGVASYEILCEVLPATPSPSPSPSPSPGATAEPTPTRTPCPTDAPCSARVWMEYS